MKKLLLSFIIINTLLTFNSCGENLFEKEVAPPHSATIPQCVVEGYLSPNSDEVQVSLQWSKPLFNTTTEALNNPYINNAKVVLFNSAKESIPLVFDEYRQIYIAKHTSFPIKEKENYSLQVEIPNTPTVTANCTIPSKFKSEIENIRIIKTSDDGSEALQIAFEFNDIPNEKNYYLADILIKKHNFNSIVRVEPFTDFNRDGKKILVRSEKIWDNNYYNKDSIEINLFSVDKSLYDYKRSILKQQDNEDLGIFKEPVFIISNINNGLGIFGAYTKISKSKKL